MKNKKVLKIPNNACCLDMPDTDLFVFAEGVEGSEKPSKVRITCYSGKVIPDHRWWGNLIIDLSGMSFPKTSTPILWEHDTDRIVGMSGTPTVTEDYQLVIEEGTILDTEDGKKVTDLSKKQFPFQASIQARPTEIEKITEKQMTEVNGQKMKGPLTVWRKSTYKETSVCVFGYDSNTDSTVFAENPENPTYFTLEVNPMPNAAPFDIAAFKAENPEAYNALTASLTAPMAAEVKEKSDKLTALTAELATAKTALAAATAQTESLATENKTTVERLSRLEKDLALRHEADLRATFSGIVQQELVKASIPTALHTKFAACINMEQFVDATTRVLDVEKAREAAVKEVSEWKTAFADPSVLGSGGNLASSPVPGAFEDSPEAVASFAASVAATLAPSTDPMKSDILGF